MEIWTLRRNSKDWLTFQFAMNGYIETRAERIENIKRLNITFEGYLVYLSGKLDDMYFELERLTGEAKLHMLKRIGDMHDELDITQDLLEEEWGLDNNE